MKLKVFAIPAHGDETAEAVVNQFTASHRVAQIDRTLIQHGVGSYWSVCIGYWDIEAGVKNTSRVRIDYREVLGEEDFRVYARLRDWRKQVAAEENIPVFGVFNNEQLANIVRAKVDSPASLGKIEGIGKTKVDRYADALIAVLGAASQSESDGADV